MEKGNKEKSMVGQGRRKGLLNEERGLLKRNEFVEECRSDDGLVGNT